MFGFGDEGTPSFVTLTTVADHSLGDNATRKVRSVNVRGRRPALVLEFDGETT